MKDMPGPHDPRGFVVEWQLADEVALGMAPGLVDLSADQPDPSDREVVVTEDVRISSITATGS
jgi:hypothetical protein